jgi:hypothetical protein
VLLAESDLDLVILDCLLDLAPIELNEDITLLDGRAQLDRPLNHQGHGPGLGSDRNLGHPLGLEDSRGDDFDLKRAALDLGGHRFAN